MAQGGLQLAQTVIPCSPPSEPPSITPSRDRSMGVGGLHPFSHHTVVKPSPKVTCKTIRNSRTGSLGVQAAAPPGSGAINLLFGLQMMSAVYHNW